MIEPLTYTKEDLEDAEIAAYEEGWEEGYNAGRDDENWDL